MEEALPSQFELGDEPFRAPDRLICRVQDPGDPLLLTDRWDPHPKWQQVASLYVPHRSAVRLGGQVDKHIAEEMVQETRINATFWRDFEDMLIHPRWPTIPDHDHQ